jgi:hypothetical protein
VGGGESLGGKEREREREREKRKRISEKGEKEGSGKENAVQAKTDDRICLCRMS